MRFQLDNDTPAGLAGLLRSFGHVVATSVELGLTRASDPEQLRTASAAGRILLTHNQNDFLLLHQAWIDWSEAWSVDSPHGGVIVVPQYPSGLNEVTAHAVHEPFGYGWNPIGEIWRWNVRHGWKQGARRGTWGDWMVSPTRRGTASAGA